MKLVPIVSSVLVVGGLGASHALDAKGLNQIASVPGAAALTAASAAKDACSKMGFHVSVTVVDAAGVVLATIRDDGAAPHTVAASQHKAYTALTTRMPTSQMAKILVANPDAFGMRQIDGLLILSGGLPIKVGDTVVGAVGVSGAPGSENDEKCGGAGLAAIADVLDGK